MSRRWVDAEAVLSVPAPWRAEADVLPVAWDPREQRSAWVAATGVRQRAVLETLAALVGGETAFRPAPSTLGELDRAARAGLAALAPQHTQDAARGAVVDVGAVEGPRSFALRVEHLPLGRPMGRRWAATLTGWGSESSGIDLDDDPLWVVRLHAHADAGDAALKLIAQEGLATFPVDEEVLRTAVAYSVEQDRPGPRRRTAEVRISGPEPRTAYLSLTYAFHGPRRPASRLGPRG